MVSRARPQSLPPETSDEITLFLADLAREGKAKNTVDGYRRDLRDFVRYFEKTTGESFATILCTPHDLAAYKSHLRMERRLAAATVNRRLAALRMLFRWALAEGRVHEDPMVKLKAVRGAKPLPKSLDRNEKNRLIRAVERSGKARDLAIVTMMLHAGLRVGEVVNLRLEDVVLRERSGTITVRSGKGDRDRTVPADADLRDALRQYLKVRPKVADDHVFIAQHGGGLSDDGVQFMLRRYGEKAGIEHCHPHRLRHTFARELLSKNVDIATVSRLLGHETIQTTMVYVQPSEKDLAEAIAKLETEW